uniref:Adenomatous polyposis coli protein 2 n=1 Tax=Varanus komodoensis TaxID=61221 RepID=A0A8D2L8Z3_VARKO
MSGSIASYDQLVRQVEALKKENTHLRRELEDNSNHLSKLENETSDMKEVLKHLQGKLEQEAKVMVSSGQMEFLDQLKALQMDISSLYSLKFRPPAQVSEPICQGRSPEETPAHPSVLQRKDSMGDLSQATIRLLEELGRERCFLLTEIEKEEKEKLWYYTQLQNLSKRLDELPHVETFSMQMDLIRQQLEFEAQHIRTLMEERFGTTDEMVQRAQIRASRLEQIDKELMEAQDKVQQSETQLCGKLSGLEEDGGFEVPTHPEEGENHPGNNKVEAVFWLLSMLATQDKKDMSRTLLAMSSSQESCLAMRKSGCLPLLVQILHDTDQEPGAAESPGVAGKDCRMRANAALHNIIFSQPDEGRAKKEMRVLHVLEQIRSYSETCWDWLRMHRKEGAEIPEAGAGLVPIESQICQATCAIMKLSFDEEYRQAMNELGGLQAVAELLQVDYEMHGMTKDPLNLALRRYTGMALTNLTFGDVVNKATLCSRQRCMQAIVAQLTSESEELHQVVSSILRNLSWRADINSKKVLREVESVTALMQCALRATKESTLKSVLSALWNLSAHSSENKAAICMVEGALAFLVSTLAYKCQSNSLAIIESGGGILRNVSSLVATREDYRQILRDHSCLQMLLQHLKSHSLTIVSNACGALWNLSARSPKDQELLWDLGAVSMLRNLVDSKHKMIAMGSAATLRNLLANRPLKYKDATVTSPSSCVPSLYMRKQKALEAELDAKHLAETFDSMERQVLKNQGAKKPTWHMESLVKDYASDSGCFDDDEVPNISGGAETGNASVLSMFLGSSFLQGQALPRPGAQRRGPEPEKDESAKRPEGPRLPPLLLPPDNEVSMAAEKLANKISTTVAKIDRLVEGITLQPSSSDSFSLSSEDHCLDWPYDPEDAREARARLCSPCRLSDSAGLLRREGPGRARTLLQLKAACSSLPNDSLNSSSASDGYCTREHMAPCTRTTFLDFKDELHRRQKRPSRLDLKNILLNRPEKADLLGKRQQAFREEAERPEPLEKAKGMAAPAVEAAEKEPKEQEKGPSAKPEPSALVHTIKLSPSYQHVPLVSNTDSGNPEPGTARYPAASSYRPQAAENVSKRPEKLPVPAAAGQEQLQKYSVEDTPICFSRCSSLSSLSSADNVLDGQSHSENELDSDSSLEIIEVEEVEEAHREEQAEKESRAAEPPLALSQPITIPFPKREKVFLRGASPSRHEDLTPSSSSENYIQETPLVMSRCSSVSSLGSFESPSIASSIQSEPCSEMVSGTVSPSELPDSPGQTMPPSRSKTPLFELGGQPEKEASQFNIQWENNVKKFMEITDFKERFQMQDLDSMAYFTVEKPNENFSCASSLSALPLHEHYVQKDVELKLIPPFPERSGLNFMMHEDGDEEGASEGQRPAERLELTSDEEVEILKECINSAMPPRFRKVRTNLISGLPAQVLHPQTKKPVHVPVYMLVPASSHLGLSRQRRAALLGASTDYVADEDSCTDSAEGTPVNFSSAASLSDETLQYPVKDNADPRRCSEKRKEGPRGTGTKAEVPPRERAGLQARRVTSSHSTPTKVASGHKHSAGSNHTSPLRAARAQSAEAKRGPGPLRNLELTLARQGSVRACSEGSRSDREGSWENGGRQSDMAFQSLCHTTPTEEAIYCFYEHDAEDLTERSRKNSPKKKAGKGPKKECWVAQKEPGKAKMAVPKCRSNLIADETPPCYSLSSSLSSLSDLELYKGEQRSHGNNGRAGRPGTVGRRSLSCNSEEDLLPKRIGLPVPKRRRPSARRTNGEKEQVASWAQKRKASVPVEDAADERGSDLDSVDWKAIQEGANSIVTWLHQAATSLGREPTSETESILSFMSGLSAGSALQLSLGRKEKKRGKDLPGGHLEKRGHPKAPQDGRKPSEAGAPACRKGRIEKTPGQQKRMTNLPVVFRGRTVIYMPDAGKEPPRQGPRSPPGKAGPATKEEAPSKIPNFNQQRSRSLHRPGKISEMMDLTLPKRSATPPARIPRAPSSGSSKTSTPSQPKPKKLPSPSQQQSRQLPPGEASKGGGNASPPAPSPKPARKSPVSKQHKTQKSPVRIPFMQKPPKKTLPTRSPMPILEEQVGRGAGDPRPKASGKAAFQNSRLSLVRMSSVRSSGNESDRSGFLRQLTFIKESSSLLMRHRAELSSAEPIPSLSQGASSHRGRLGLPTVFLCSSRCDDLKVDKPAGPSQRPVISRVPLPGHRAPAGTRPPRRTSSESPSRLPVKSGGGPPEPFKRYSSSPQINVAKRTASPAPGPPSCPQSSGGGKKAEETKEQLQAKAKGTWKRIRDEDIPHILRSTLPSTALPLVSTLREEESRQAWGDLQRKTSDAVVQTEDFAAAKTHSSTSPTLGVQEAPKIPSDGCEVDTFAPGKATFGHEVPVGALGNFPPSRHSSPSRAVRVTPFNYTPSPMAEPNVNEKQVEKVQV